MDVAAFLQALDPGTVMAVGGVVVAMVAGWLIPSPIKGTPVTTAYYECPIVGDGKTTETAFRPKVSIYPDLKWTWYIPTDPKTGFPIPERPVVVVEAKDHSKLEADPEITTLTVNEAVLKSADILNAEQAQAEKL